MKPGYYVYDNHTVIIIDLEGFHWWLDGTKDWVEYNVYPPEEINTNDIVLIKDYDIKNFDKSIYNYSWYKEILSIKKELFYKDIISGK